MIYQDGHWYASADDVPDLGSLVCVEERPFNVREYRGLIADVYKLPTYDDLATGSFCYFVDTGAVYMYEASSSEWILQV